VLEAEEVLSLEDLRLLAGHTYFDSCGLSVINVLKIRKALLEDEDDDDEGMGRGSGGEGMSELDMAAATPLFLARTLSEQLSDEIAMADKETADTAAKDENKDKKLRDEGTGNLEGGRGKGGGKGRHGKGIGGMGKGGMGKGGLFGARPSAMPFRTAPAPSPFGGGMGFGAAPAPAPPAAGFGGASLFDEEGGEEEEDEEDDKEDEDDEDEGMGRFGAAQPNLFGAPPSSFGGGATGFGGGAAGFGGGAAGFGGGAAGFGGGAAGFGGATLKMSRGGAGQEDEDDEDEGMGRGYGEGGGKGSMGKGGMGKGGMGKGRMRKGSMGKGDMGKGGLFGARPSAMPFRTAPAPSPFGGGMGFGAAPAPAPTAAGFGGASLFDEEGGDEEEDEEDDKEDEDDEDEGMGRGSGGEGGGKGGMGKGGMGKGSMGEGGMQKLDDARQAAFAPVDPPVRPTDEDEEQLRTPRPPVAIAQVRKFCAAVKESVTSAVFDSFVDVALRLPAAGVPAFAACAHIEAVLSDEVPYEVLQHIGMLYPPYGAKLDASATKQMRGVAEGAASSAALPASEKQISVFGFSRATVKNQKPPTEPAIVVGARVRVREGVTPSLGWGGVTRDSIGTVVAVRAPALGPPKEGDTVKVIRATDPDDHPFVGQEGVIVGDIGGPYPFQYLVKFEDGINNIFHKGDVEVKLDLKVKQTLTRCVFHYRRWPGWLLIYSDL
jgi:hypothetical protein